MLPALLCAGYVQKGRLNMKGGWICLHRSIRESAVWKGEPFSRGQAFIDLLLGAYYKDGSAVVHGRRMSLLRGELATSISELAERWGWSRGKVSRFLKMLSDDESIVFKTDRLCTIIRILNFDSYQAKKESAKIHKDEQFYEQWKDQLAKAYGFIDD